MDSFKALVVNRTNDSVQSELRSLTTDELPAGELLVKVVYSSVNYKDALACSSNGNIVTAYPFVPGIDLAGIVVSSEDDHYHAGDEIVVTGNALGVSHFGGYSEYARVPAEWAVKLPQGLSLREAMILGTAGFTAALSVQEIQNGGVTPDKGPILVTGATGGVGSLSVAILAKLGYEVVASTGKMDQKNMLLSLGASRVISREEIIPEKSRALDKQLWAGVVDCVGGKSLTSILSCTQYAGVVAISGLTGGVDIATTVFPFIIRGIRLMGIDSVYASMKVRLQIWERLATDLKPDALETICTEISLEQIPSVVSSMLKGNSHGRTVVKIACAST
jgi:acrylyl-CoA reductase (NADPH)